MENKFPDALFVSESGSGEDAYLSASKTEEDAVSAADDPEVDVAEYKLVTVRRRKIQTTVVDA